MAPRTIDLEKARRADLHPDALWHRRLRGKLYALRALLKRLGRKTSAEKLADALDGPVRAKDWPAARAVACRWAGRAEAAGDRVLLKQVGNDMRRLGDYARSFELIAGSHAGDGAKEWRGNPLAGKALLIQRREGDLANFLQSASVVALAIEHCRACIVLVDQRLVPLYRRTFPEVDVRVEHRDEAEALAIADYVTSFETLAWRLGWDARQSVFLKPDEDLARSFRQSYAAASGRPSIGIAWGSLNKKKDVPEFGDWKRLLEAVDAQFVSLQYGDTASVVASFEAALPGRVMADDTVDQLVDMDRFAAQVVAMDAVVTISNTVAHTAGALGVPTIVLLDGSFSMSWPSSGSAVPWYEKVTLLRKANSQWDSVMEGSLPLLVAMANSDTVS